MRNVMQNLDLSIEALLLFGQEGTEYNPAPAYYPTGLGGSKIAYIKFKYSF